MSGKVEHKNKLIQLIHIAKAKCKICSECGVMYFGQRCGRCGSQRCIHLDERAYRAFLSGVTKGKDSCVHLSFKELEQVLKTFKDAGFQIKQRRAFNPAIENTKQKSKIMEAINSRASSILGEHWENRLNGYIKSIGRDSIEFCDTRDLRRISGFLSRLEKSNLQPQK